MVHTTARATDTTVHWTVICISMSEALLSAASMPSDSSSEKSGFGVLRVTVGNGTYEVDENVKSAIILNTLSKIN